LYYNQRNHGSTDQHCPTADNNLNTGVVRDETDDQQSLVANEGCIRPALVDLENLPTVL
ncbi:unnamed protein product, partial [Rotaria sp. Silwood2]